MEDQYGFTIDSSLVKEISSENYTSYTFLIHRDVVTDISFENLVVTIDSLENVKAHLIAYHLNNDPIYIEEDDAYSFDAEVEFMEIVYNANSQDRIFYVGADGCIMTLTCPYGGSDHPAGDACIDADRGDLVWASSGCGGSSGGGPGGEASPGGSSGGGGGSGTPPQNNYDPTDPDMHGNGGNQPVIITTPVIDEEVNQEDPCNKIAEQIANANFEEKVDIVNSSSAFNDDKETGFSQDINGAFIQLPAINGGHSLLLPKPLPINMIGYLHSHINSYEVPDQNGDGIPDRIKPIKMPSPGDILIFLKLLVNADTNNIPLSDVYGSMYSNTGNYTLKFTGDINDVLTNINSLSVLEDNGTLKKKFKEYFNDFKNNPKAFLRFLKNEIEIEGIRLFKIKNNGTIKEKMLNSNNNVTSETC